MIDPGSTKLMGIELSCVFCCVIIFVIGNLSICIPAIILGQFYRDQCPVENRIPQFLFNFQLINLCGGIVLLLFACSFICAALNVFGRLTKIGGRCLYLIPLILINFFLIGQFIYLIFGSIWTFSVYKTVQYSDKEIKASYCHYRLFRMALGFIILAYIQLLSSTIIMVTIGCHNHCWGYLTFISKKKRIVTTVEQQQMVEIEA